MKKQSLVLLPILLLFFLQSCATPPPQPREPVDLSKIPTDKLLRAYYLVEGTVDTHQRNYSGYASQRSESIGEAASQGWSMGREQRKIDVSRAGLIDIRMELRKRGVTP